MDGRSRAVRWGWLGTACGAVLLAAACSGGGGGGGGGLNAYAGATTPADITVANATAVTSGVLGAATRNHPALAQWAKAGGEAASTVDALDSVMRRLIRARSGALGKAGGPVRGASKATFACNGPGTGTYTVDDRTNASGVGTVRYEFFDCDFGDGVVINGTDIDRIASDTSSVAGDAWSGRETGDVRLALAGTDYLFQFDVDYDLDEAALLDTYMGTSEFWDSTHGGGFRTEDADSTYTFADSGDWGDDCANSVDWSGRVYDGALGYVDAMTTAPLAWTGDDCGGAGPSSGGPLVLTGDAGDEIDLTPQSDTDVQMVVDEDADGTSDATSTVTYASLGLT